MSLTVFIALKPSHIIFNLIFYLFLSVDFLCLFPFLPHCLSICTDSLNVTAL